MKNFNWKKILIWILGIWIGLKLLGKVFKPIGDMFTAIGNSLSYGIGNKAIAKDNTATSSGGINEANRAAVARDVAEKIQVDFYNYAKNFFGYYTPSVWFFEDTSDALAQLNRLNNSTEASIASQNYAAITAGFDHKKSLLADVNKYFSTSERSQIKPSVYIGLY